MAILAGASVPELLHAQLEEFDRVLVQLGLGIEPLQLRDRPCTGDALRDRHSAALHDRHANPDFAHLISCGR